MDKKDIQTRVTKVVCQVLNVDPEMVQADSNFAYDLGAESSQSVQLIAGFEEEFGINMDSDAAMAVQTVGGAVDFIARHVK
jgi:acyl carrier protein